MPITKSAKKALRVTKRKTVINRNVRSRLKTFVDAMKNSPSAEALSNAFSAIDRAKKSNIIPKNRAARMKSQLHKLLPTK